MANPFQSPLQMLAWSHEHFKRLQANLSAFDERVGKERIVDFDPETRHYLHKVRLSGPLPWAIPLMAFDCVSAQRAALDHAMYASAVALNLPLDGTKFPITPKNSRDDAKRDAARKGGQHDPAIIDMALSFEPYKGGDRFLLGLNEVRNLKHHRFLVPTSANASQITISDIFARGDDPADPGSGEGLIMAPPEWNAAKNELTYMRAGIKLPDYNSEITISASFDEGTPFEGELVTAVLNNTGSIVQKVVMAIKAETERLA